MEMLNNYDVGIYCRLSRDDNNGHLESMSISNQRQVLKDYVQEKGWYLVDEYIDDGFTGTNFDRPDFKRMISDVEMGKINCIVTKDLSRLGRNYVQAGYYTDEFFIEHDIRFIAINDGIDTIKEDNDIAAFHHVLNEIYPKQVSKKVRQVKKKSAQQGKFMGSQAPYGYKKSAEDKHVLVIDEEAALIVKRLFCEFASGDSARLIADRLNREKVNSPRFYHYEKMGRENPLSEQKNVWGSATVLQPLRNQVYIGNMVQGKRQVVSFKTKKMRQVSPENWIVVEHTHEPIIDKDLWDRVHELMSGKKSRVAKTKCETLGMFAGIVKCADCGSPLAFMRKPLKSGERKFYRCSRYNNYGAQACSTHFIDETDLCQFVLNDIRQYARLTEREKEQIANRLLSLKRKNQKSEVKVLTTQLNESESRLNVIAATLKNLYIDKCAGKVPENVFVSLMNDFSVEEASLKEHIPKLKKELANIQETKGEIDDWLSLISSYADIKTLTRATVMELIDNILVSERQTIDGKVIQSIEIQYRFIGDLLNEPQQEQTKKRRNCLMYQTISSLCVFNTCDLRNRVLNEWRRR